MRKNPFFKRLMKDVRASWVNLACVLMILLLTSACAGGNSKQTLSRANETRQVSAKGESQNGGTYDGQEIECRWKIITGSIIRKKVCTTKKGWATIDKELKRDADEFRDEIKDKNATYGKDSSDTSTEPNYFP